MRKKNSKKKKKILETATEFEKEIVYLLELAGYANVRWHVKFYGTIFDCIAEYQTITGPRHVIVEVKHLNSKCGTGPVDKLAGVLQRIDKVDHAIIISKKGFSAGAYRSAQQSRGPPLLLKTPTELVLSQLNFNSGMYRTMKAFESEDIHKWYVPVPLKHKINGKRINVDTYIDKWIKNPSHCPTILFGGYGMGKTTFAKMLFYRLANAFINGKQVPIPLLIKLRDCGRGLRLESLLTSYVVDDLGVKGFSKSHFRWLAQNGVFLLILDGFDEMTPGATDEEIIANIAEIGRLVDHCRLSIITCRPEFFKTEAERVKLLKQCVDANDRCIDLELGELDYWSRKDVTQYISKRFDKVEKITQLISKVHDLRDLSKRPVLLNMICSSSNELIKAVEEKETKAKITSSDLYEIYINSVLNRDIRKGVSSGISTGLRIDYMMILATHITVEKKQSLAFSDFTRLIEKFQLPKQEAIIDAAYRQTFARTLLIRDRGNEFRFSHYSFQEYLTALCLLNYYRDQLNYVRNIRNLAENIELSGASANFASDMIADINNLVQILNTLVPADELLFARHLGQIFTETTDFLGQLGQLDAINLIQLLSILTNKDDMKSLSIIEVITSKISESSFENLVRGIIKYTNPISGYKILNSMTKSKKQLETKVRPILDRIVSGISRNFTVDAFKSFITFRQSLRRIAKDDRHQLAFNLFEPLLSEMTIAKSEISGLELHDLKITNIHLNNVVFSGCSLINVEFQKCDIELCDFYSCDLGYIAFNDCLNMNSCSFTQCRLLGTNFIGCRFDINARRRGKFRSWKLFIESIKECKRWESAYWPENFVDQLDLRYREPITTFDITGLDEDDSGYYDVKYKYQN